MGQKSGKKQTNLILKGGVMAVAFLLSGVVLLLRQIPLTGLWNDSGNGIYAAACGIFSLAWLLSSYGICATLAYLLKPRLRQGQYQEAGRIVKAAFCYATLTGAGLGAALLFGASYLMEYVVLEPLGMMPLQVLAFSLVFMAWNGVLRGFFLGNGAEFPVAVSLVAEQLVAFAVGFPFAKLRREYGAKVGALLQQEAFRDSFAAAGFMRGVAAGAALSFLFLLSVRLLTSSYYKEKRKQNGKRDKEGFHRAFALFGSCLLPLVLYGIVFYGYLAVQQLFFRQFMSGGMKTSEITQQWGVYFGKYKMFSSLPLLLGMAMASTLRERVRSCYRKEDYPRMRNLIQNVFQAVMLTALPVSVMIGTAAKPLLALCFPSQDTETAAALLLTGCLTGALYAAAYLMAEILWGIEKKTLLLLCGAGAFAVHLGALYVLLEALHLDIAGVLYADILYAFCLFFLCMGAVQKSCRLRTGLLRGLAAAAIACAVMGTVLYLLCRFLSGKLPAGILFAVCAVVGFLLYSVVLLLLRGATQRQLHMAPGGRWVAGLGRILRLL